MAKNILIVFLFFMLTACSGNTDQATPTIAAEVNVPTQKSIAQTPTPPAYLPQAEDSSLTRANAFPKSIDLLTVGTDPLRLELVISGYLPTPCHELRVYVPPPDEENKISVEVYSLGNPEMICAQVLRAFSATVELGTYPKGSYQVWVNGEFVGNFDS
jgi:hypothetical protein